MCTQGHKSHRIGLLDQYPDKMSRLSQGYVGYLYKKILNITFAF